MKYLKIKNNGLLDIRLVALMGGTTKANDEFKIGQFGTGLKYTLAYLIRNNIDFHIFVGKDEVDIKTEKETIRDQVFNIVCINGNRTSITDMMGHEWSAWMIIRELWCNALDEGGSFREVTEALEGEDDTTCFYIQVTPEIKAVVDNWKNYFVHEVEPVFSDDYCAIYPGGDSLRIYKNGVLIKEDKRRALYAYDLKSASINEMREYNGSLSHPMWSALRNADVKTVTHFLESVNEKHFEADADWEWYDSFSNTWKEAIGEAKIIHQEAIDNINGRGIEVDLVETIVVPKTIYKALTKQFKGIGALRIADKVNEFYETYSSEADEKIKQGLVILEEAGYNFSPELKFIYGVFGDKRVRARVNLDTKEVLISENIGTLPLSTVVSILIEENEHLKTGFSDHTREFQQHFIDLYAHQLLKACKIQL